MFQPEEREAAIVAIVADLSKGIPLSIICGRDGMPATSTVYEWMADDEVLSGRIARARDLGWDALAYETLAISDDGARDTMMTSQGPKPDREWIDRSKLRVHTRLELLKRWDPKRYADMVKHAGADGSNLKLIVASEDAAL